MDQKELTTPSNVVERNIRLTGQIMKFILDHPKTLDSLPDRFELVVLPEDDPEICLYNLRLLERHSKERKNVVFARLDSRTANIDTDPSFFVPLAA
jgi:hypothetical protein